MSLLLEGGRQRIEGRRRGEFPSRRRRRPLGDDSPAGDPVAADGTNGDHVGGSRCVVCSLPARRKAAEGDSARPRLNGE